jgi:hypothetical protein
VVHVACSCRNPTHPEQPSRMPNPCRYAFMLLNQWVIPPVARQMVARGCEEGADLHGLCSTFLSIPSALHGRLSSTMSRLPPLRGAAAAGRARSMVGCVSCRHTRHPPTSSRSRVRLERARELLSWKRHERGGSCREEVALDAWFVELSDNRCAHMATTKRLHKRACLPACLRACLTPSSNRTGGGAQRRLGPCPPALSLACLPGHTAQPVRLPQGSTLHVFSSGAHERAYYYYYYVNGGRSWSVVIAAALAPAACCSRASAQCFLHVERPLGLSLSQRVAARAARPCSCHRRCCPAPAACCSQAYAARSASFTSLASPSRIAYSSCCCSSGGTPVAGSTAVLTCASSASPPHLQGSAHSHQHAQGKHTARGWARAGVCVCGRKLSMRSAHR